MPVLVIEKAYVPDSGGPGRHRGGLGQRVSVRKLDDDGLPTLASVYPEGVGIEVPGLFGGKPGRSARGVVRDASGAIIQDCGTGELVSTTTEQEIVEVCLSGGSGFGSPFERPLSLIARDLAEGYVTAGGGRARLRRGHRGGRQAGHGAKARGGASPARRRSDAS